MDFGLRGFFGNVTKFYHVEITRPDVLAIFKDLYSRLFRSSNSFDLFQLADQSINYQLAYY